MAVPRRFSALFVGLIGAGLELGKEMANLVNGFSALFVGLIGAGGTMGHPAPAALRFSALFVGLIGAGEI